MRILLWLLLICSPFKVYSQHSEKYFGVIGEISISKDLTILRPNILYNYNKFQFIVGPVISKVIVLDESKSYEISTEEQYKITGAAIGIKFRLKSLNGGKVYFFMDNLFLNYHTYERLEYINGNKNSIGLTYGSTDGSKLTLIQPIVGIGDEIWFGRYVIFSLDVGAGFINRKYHYDDPNDNHYYPNTLFTYTAQLRLNLGIRF